MVEIKKIRRFYCHRVFKGAHGNTPRPLLCLVQNGLLYIELLGSACGRWATKNTGDTSIGVGYMM